MKLRPFDARMERGVGVRRLARERERERFDATGVVVELDVRERARARGRDRDRDGPGPAVSRREDVHRARADRERAVPIAFASEIVLRVERDAAE